MQNSEPKSKASDKSARHTVFPSPTHGSLGAIASGLPRILRRQSGCDLEE
jgi:hypothetical protein